jgi:hypothetical protein
MSSSAYAAVSVDSSCLESLRISVESNPTQRNEQQYLNAFPSTFKKFKRTFYGKELDELYPTHEEHLELLERLYAKYPDKVKSIWFGVATDGSWDADAIGMLQDQLAKYGAEKTKEFAKDIQVMPLQKRKSIIRFLADVENHDAYSEYQTILKNLQSLGYSELYKDFILAKEQRMKRNDH